MQSTQGQLLYENINVTSSGPTLSPPATMATCSFSTVVQNVFFWCFKENTPSPHQCICFIVRALDLVLDKSALFSSVLTS